MSRMLPLTEYDFVRESAIVRTQAVHLPDGRLKELLIHTSSAGVIRLPPDVASRFVDLIWGEEGEAANMRSLYRRLSMEEEVL